MSSWNQSNFRVPEFILVGFPGFQDKESKNILLSIFLMIYLLILLGNVLIIVILSLDEGLYIPMYLLILNLAVLDIAISTTTIPKLISALLFNDNIISFAGCFIQMGCWLGILTATSFLLALMAYDRYLAICSPLHYPAIMSNSLAMKQSLFCWLAGLVVGGFLVILALRLPFCGPNKIIHCYCDHSSVLRLACADTVINNYLGLAIALCILILPLLYIFFSYFKIVMAVIKITTSEGRLKAFSTCGTHLLIISVFFLLTIFIALSYRIPGISADSRIMVSLLQSVIPPLANPFIYCFKSKEIRGSLEKTVKRSTILPRRS
ncbi:olfactory receptor 10A3-like [Erpetoichthys calabaricus]|uniref:olfactory receptor 10A3-like n=1 Tax=Erpetoichthys calabaricus TaxID=27687 RepID=UPI0022346B4C|nr:olfactory receptor 10A3-like [Erpetoichthys calabaricus]